MLMLLAMTMITFMIMSILMMICMIISKKSFMDREKNSPFECGFDPYMNSRLPFSLQFFLIAIIFLIFDVEITLLIPFIFIMKIMNLYLMFYSMTLFISILLIGIYHEWYQGALNWYL